MFTSESLREEFANELKFEEARERRAESPEKREKINFTPEFWAKQKALNEKLQGLRPSEAKVEVIEKKVEPKKPYSQRRKYFNPGMLDRKTI